MAGEDTAGGSYSWSFGQVPASDAPSGAPGKRPTRADGSQRRPQITGLAALEALFDIQEILGRGGMGIVYRARDAFGRDLALKVMSGRLDQEQRKRFQREGELTASLTHPGIVKIHAGGEVEGVPYLAYELIPGGRTFEDTRKELDRPAQLGLLHQAAEALGYAHSKGVVHRDVKPENVLVDADGRPHLADFGLAWTSTAETLTKTGAFVGTPTYMSPEQFFGSSHDQLGPQTDVWALGVMLYEVLTGKLPFDATSLLELGAMVRHGDVVACREHDVTVSPELEAVCLKALERDIGQRYPNASAFARDLGAALGDRGVSALRERVGARWRRRLTLAALGIALALGAALAVRMALKPRPLTAADLARTTSAFEAHTQSSADLEAALAKTPAGVEQRVRLAAHLALAREPATEPAAWRNRLGHARRVLELDPEPAQRILAESIVGEAHSALGEHALAARAFERVLKDSTDLDLLERTAKALLTAGEAQAAERLATRLIDRRLSRGGLELLFAARLGTQDWKGARTILGRLPPSVKTESLRARLALARGEDPVGILRAAARTWPKTPLPHLELACALWRELDAPAAALDVAERALDAGQRDPQLIALAKTLRTLLSEDPQLSDIATSLREDAARWLLSEAERDQAIAARHGDHRYFVPENALAGEEHEKRAAKALELASRLIPPGSPLEGRLHLALAVLEGPESQHLDRAQEPGTASPRLNRLLASRLITRGDARGALEVLGDDDGLESLLLRGRALLALGRPGDAEPCLRTAAGPLRDWAPACRALANALEALGRTQEAQAERERALLLESPRRQAAKQALDEIRDGPLLRNGSYEAVRDVLDQRVFVHDPLDTEALLMRGMKGFLTRQPKALQEMGRAARLSANLPRRLTGALFALSSNATSLVGRSRVLEALERPFDPLRANQDQLLFHALLTAWAVEYEGREDLVDAGAWELSLCLRRDPGGGSARVMRAFLMIRAGHLEQAARDLRVCREQAPGCPSIAFYQTLLDARLREPPEVILRGLKRTRELNFKVWGESGWKPEIYPELRDYAQKSALDEFWREVR